MLDSVFVLNHTYGSDEEEDENWKQLGVYSSLKEVELAIQRFARQPGFRENKEGFVINKYLLNSDNNGWEEGFLID